MTACPFPEVLKQLLAGSLADPDVRAVREHLGGCASCQALLDRLSDHPQLRHWIDAGKPSAAVEPNTPPRVGVRETPCPTLRWPPSAPGTPTEAAGPALAFLSPPEQEGDLGRLGPYRILSELGRGGMGIVLKAYDPALARTVALKVLRPELADDSARARFVREARAAAAINHEHVIAVYAVANPDDGPPYLVMHYVEGPTLRDCIQAEHRLDPRAAAELLWQVADGLAAAHAAGLVHRDIKPANVIVDARGRARIVDFGLARIMDQPGGITRQGVVVGTPDYMSPEQIRAPDRIDGRSDIYNVGVTLYEALTGGVPFRGATQMVLHQILNDEPASPRRLNDRIPRDLETICLKCLEKEPARRYGSAAALADDLRRFLGGEPIRARPVRAPERGWRWCRRNPGLAFSTSAAALLLVTVAVVASLSAWWLNAEQKATQEQLRQTQEAERRGKHQLFQAKLAQAQARRWSRQVGQRFASWQALTEAAELARELELDEEHFRNLRNEAIACLALADIRLVQQWEGWPAGSSAGLAFDAGLEHYARSDLQGNLSIRRVADDQELARLPGAGRAGTDFGAKEIQFSPNGTLLAVKYWNQLPGQPTNFRLWDWQRGTSVFQPSFPITGWDFSRDGRYLALGHSRGGLTLHEAGTGKEVSKLGLDFPPSHVACHPGGGQVAVASSADGAVQVWDVATGSRLYQLSGPGNAYAMTWHPDGVLLAVAYQSQGAPLFLWDTATQQRHAVLQGHQNTITGVAFAPGGDLLLSTAWDGTSRLWDPWMGRELLRFPGDARHFSRDGRHLVSLVGSKLAVWEVAPGREYRTLPGVEGAGKEGLREGGFSPDGRWLAVATSQGVRLWDLARGKERPFLRGSLMWDAKFHPSGQALFICAPAGLYHWPWQMQADVLRIGPARQLPVPAPSSLVRVGLDRQGRTLAGVYGQKPGGGCILDLEDPAGKVRSLRHDVAVFVATSADGRWVATGTHNGFGVKVWEAASGQLAFPDPLIPDERWATVAFSPDDRWLVTGTDTAFAIWEVGTWKRARQLRRKQAADVAGSIAFSPDGKILALAISLSVVHLIDPETGRLYAQLEAPDPDPIRLVGFSPDGSQLVVATAAEHPRVWDLRQLRAQLKPIGLDWDLPPYAPPGNPDAKPLEVRVVGDFGAVAK